MSNQYFSDTKIQPENDYGTSAKRFVLRVVRYWPIILLLFIISMLGAFLYLRYTTKIYKVSTRVVVNDDSQERGTNLLESLNASFRNIDKLTEREIEILKSQTLITNVISTLNMGVEWEVEGRITQKPVYSNEPFDLKIANPDSVSSEYHDVVSITKEGLVSFGGKSYRPNVWEHSPFGKIMWVPKSAISDGKIYQLSIYPSMVSAVKYKSALSVTPITKGSAIVDVQLVDAVPERAKLFLTTLIDTYGKNNVEFKNRIYENSLSFIDSRLGLVSAELESVEGNLQDLKKREGIVNLSEQSKMFLDQIKNSDLQVSEIDVQLNVLNELETYVQNRNKDLTAPPASLGLADPVLTSLLQQLFTTELEAEKQTKLSGPKNPQAQVLSESIAKLRSSIISSISNLRQSLIVSKQKLKQETNRFNSLLQSVPQKERALLDISRQQQIKNNIYTFLLEKREEAALTAASQVSNHRIIDPPTNLGVVKPRSSLVYVSAYAFFVLASFLVIYFLEFNNNRILFRDELERSIDAPILGEIIKTDGDEPIVVGSGKRTVIAEQIRELRTNLSFFGQSGKSRVILFTSSIPGEGKSFLSLNLAASLAQAGKKVVIMEFDLRKPKLSKLLGVARQPGISNYCINNATYSELLKPVAGEDGLWLISSGPIPPNPTELIMNGEIEQLFTELKRNFDFVIIDAPPVGSVTDAKLLASFSDQTLYIVRHNLTPASYLKFIRSQIQSKILPNVSLVFNGIELNRNLKYGYEYGYGYGYGYGYSETTKKKGFFSRKNK